MSGQNGKVLSFGPFELSIGNRLLTNGTKVVPLGARAMDILIVLVEQANKVVSRRTLIERVWPKRGADDVSLRVHISALRKALAQNDPTRRYITNVPGRGYSFIVPITSPSEGDIGDRLRFEVTATRPFDAHGWSKGRYRHDPGEAGRGEVRYDRWPRRYRQDHRCGCSRP